MMIDAVFVKLGSVGIQVVVLVWSDWFRFRGVRRKDMLAYSTKNTPENGPVGPNP